VTPSATAETAHGHAATGSLTVTPGTTAGAQASGQHLASASLTVNPAETAEREHAATGSAELDITVELAAVSSGGSRPRGGLLMASGIV
jgi:hypothetical protein